MVPQPSTEPINSVRSEKQNSTDSVTIHNSRQALVEKLINEDAPSWKLHSKRLLAFESLNHLFGETSETMQYLLKIEKNSLLRSLSKFIEKDPSERSALISRLASEQAAVDKFDPSRLEAIIKIENLFPQGSPYLEKLYQQESNGAKLSDIATFLEQSNSKNLIISSLGNKAEGEPDNATPKESSAKLLLQNLLESNATTEKLTFSYLTARTKLNGYFGTDSPTMSRIIELSEHGLSLSNLKEFIDEDVDAHKLMVQRLVDAGATAEALNATRLRGISILIQKLQPDQESFGHLLSLEKQGLNLGALAQYVSEDPHSRVPQINTLLTQRASVAELNLKRLADATMMTKVSSYFAGDDNAIKYISQLQANDLSANRLMGFIEEWQQSRIELVKKLISEGAGTDRFNQHMTLSLFPDDVAYKILESSERDGTQTAQLIGALKNFKTGEQFYHTVTAWVRDGHPASIPMLLELNDQIKQGNLQVDISKEADQNATLRARSTKGAELASVLKAAVEGIDKQIPKDQPIVLLGRDNWPLLPLLKEQGRPVQYFLWSRLQNSDAKTKAQWLKEVPPNAAVVDTGYSGSIIDWIRKIDAGAKGYLLSSGGRYPQLLSSGMASNVSKIEYFPKLVGRARTYTENGGAVSKSKDRDYDEQAEQKDVTHRWHVQRANTDLLKASGLSDWSVWRYSDFVGLTPKERLGFDTNAEVDEHYKNIEQLRKETKTPTSSIEPEKSASPFQIDWTVGGTNMSPPS